MKPRIIVCGLDRTGYKIFCLLRQQGACVVGVHHQPISGDEANVIVGDLQAASTLLSAGIREAHTLVLAGADDALNLAILMQARVLNPKIRIINRLFNTSLGDRLDQTLPDHVTMSVAALAAPVFAFDALGNQAIGQLQLFNQTWPIHEEYIDENHPWKGRRLRDFWDERSRMLIYYLPVDSRIDLVSAVVQGHSLQQGDRLIVGTKPSIRTTHKSLIQKLLKVVTSLKQFQQHGQSVLVVTLVLFVMILIATLTYVCIDLKTSIVDALYFSVGMITGAGGKEEVAEHAPDSIKLFTAVMMLVGAAVVGICYALLNDCNLNQVAALLTVTSNDAANLEIALNAKGLTPSIPVIVRYEDPNFARMAQQVFEFEAVLCPAELAAPAFAAAALGGRILGNGMTADSLWVALATLITPAHPFCGQGVTEAAMVADFVPLSNFAEYPTVLYGGDG